MRSADTLPRERLEIGIPGYNTSPFGQQASVDLTGAMSGSCGFIYEAVAAVDLGGVSRVVHRGFRGHQFGDRRLFFKRLARERERGCVVIGRSRNVDPCLHPGDLEGDAEIGADGGPKASRCCAYFTLLSTQP